MKTKRRSNFQVEPLRFLGHRSLGQNVCWVQLGVVRVCVLGCGSGRAMCYKTWPLFLNKAVGTWFPIEDGVGRNYKTFLVQKPIRTILLPSLP